MTFATEAGGGEDRVPQHHLGAVLCTLLLVTYFHKHKTKQNK